MLLLDGTIWELGGLSAGFCFLQGGMEMMMRVSRNGGCSVYLVLLHTV